MELEDRGYLVFLGIVIFDITLFSLTLFLWSKYRLKIIALTHNGFSNRNVRFTKILSDSDNLVEDKNKILKVVSPHSIGKKGIPLTTHRTNYVDLNSRASGSVSHAAITHFRSSSNDNSGLYVKLSNESIGTYDMPGVSALTRALNKYKNSERWWNPLLCDCSNKIENNEAKLYLKFMGQTYKMLLICFMFSVIVNGCVFLYFLSQGNPHIFLVYTFEDMLNCKVTTWALYILVWVYSFVSYYFVSVFRNNLDGKKQVTAILRPQLHTIMVAGFNKNITNPSLIYNHFNGFFPGQVISAHIVMDHSKRLRYEHELENEKLQLTGLYDLVSISSTCHLNKYDLTNIRESALNHPSVTQTYGKSSIVRSLSANFRLSEIITRKSESDDKKICKSLSSQNLTYISTKKSEVPSSQTAIEKESHEYYGDMKQHFTKHIDRIKRLKMRIEEEKNKVHTSARLCFVSFADSNIVLHILKDSKILDVMPQWHISPAPHPNDLIWLNLHISRYNVFLRMLFFNFLIVVFYVGVTYLLIKLNMIKRFTKVEVGEADLEQSPITLIRSTFWQGVIQSIVTLVINSAVHPPLILYLSKYIGFWTQTSLQKYLLFGHIFYLFTSTIFVPLLASMIAIWQVFDGAVHLLSLELGKMLINTSWKYVTFHVMNATFLIPCNQLLQISQLGCRYFSQLVFNVDSGVPFFDLGFWYAYHLSILTLVLLFGVFIPYLLPFAALYFAVRYYVDRHNIAYQLSQFPLDSSGHISSSAVKSMLFCVSLAQFIMSGVFLHCRDMLPSICIMILYIAPVTTWLIMYGSYGDSVIESIHSFYQIKLKPLNQKMLQVIQVCYMHPCDVRDLIDAKPLKQSINDL